MPLFRVLLLVAVAAAAQPFGIATMRFWDVERQETDLLTLNLRSGQSGRYLAPSIPFWASEYFINIDSKQSPMWYVFGQFSAALVDVHGALVKNYTKFKTPVHSRLNGRWFSMSYAGYDSRTGQLYGFMQKNDNTWHFYRADFTSQQWILLTTLALPNVFVPRVQFPVLFCVLTRDNTKLLITWWTVQRQPDGSATTIQAVLYDIESNTWATGGNVTSPVMPTGFPPIPLANGNMLFSFQDNVLRQYTTSGQLVASFSPDWSPCIYNIAAVSLIGDDKGRYMLPGTSTSPDSSVFQVRLLDVDKGALAYSWDVALPQSNSTWPQCQYSWMLS